METAMSTKLPIATVLTGVSLFAAPFVVLAAAGALEARAVPVAALLGLFVVGLAAYLASAASLFERRHSERPQALGARPALGGC
jgi:hypothetical protein